MIALPRNRIWLAVALALTALKLWLTRGQGIYAIGGADDQHFIELAQHLVRGEWLGPYSELTLVPGQFYPLFIAAAFVVGVPLFLAQHLLYAAACGLFVRALRPAVTRAGARLALYALLLSNPMTFDGPSMGRVLRQHLSGPLVLMVFAGLVALYLRRTEPARRLAPWVLLLGLADAAFYLTGEGVLWIVPSLLLLAGAYLYGSWQISRDAAQRAAVWLGVALAIAAFPVLLVCVQNQRHYDRFSMSEFRAAASPDDGGTGLWSRLGSAVDFVASFSRFSARVPPSTGSPEELQLFRDLTHERLSPPVGELDKVGAARYVLNGQKVEGLQQIGKTLRPVLTTLFWLAQALALLRVAWLGLRRQWNYPLTVAVAAWFACAAAVFRQAMIPASSSSVLVVSDFAPVYLLMLVFIGATGWERAAAWSKRGAAPLPTTVPGASAG